MERDSDSERLPKCFEKFLQVAKMTLNNEPLENLFLSDVYKESEKMVKNISTQQVLSLLNTLSIRLNKSLLEISKKTEDCNEFTFELLCCLYILLLKEVRVHAPNISSKTFEAFSNELEKLKSVLEEFGHSMIQKFQFTLKNESLLKWYLELSFYCHEIQAIMHFYQRTFLNFSSLSLESAACPAMTSNQWNDLVRLYFTGNLQNCSAVFLQLAIQRIKIFHLWKKNFQLENSSVKIILKVVDSNSASSQILHHLNPENLDLVTKSLPFEESKFLTCKFLKNFLLRENDVGSLSKWLIDDKLKESDRLVKFLFLALLKETNEIGSEALSGKAIGKKFQILRGEYFDSLNKIEAKKITEGSSLINFLLKESGEVSELIEHHSLNSRNSWKSLKNISEILKELPLAYAERDTKSLALIMSIELMIFAARNEAITASLLRKLYELLCSDVEVRTYFDTVVLLLNYLTFSKSESELINSLKLKVIQELVKLCLMHDRGIEEISQLIDQKKNIPNALDARLAIYHQLSKSSHPEGKRKRKNDRVYECRNKMARTLIGEVNDFLSASLNDQNYEAVLKILTVHLDEDARKKIRELSPVKFHKYFKFAVDKLRKEYDDACSFFILKLLEMFQEIRNTLPDDSLYQIWLSLFKNQWPKMTNWQLFALNSSDSEFEKILKDLLDATTIRLSIGSSIETCSTASYFEIWQSFLEVDSEIRLNKSQMELQKLFNYVRECPIATLDKLDARGKIQLINFFCYCLSSKKVVVTSQMVDAITDFMVCHHLQELKNDRSDPHKPSIQDFHDFFVKKVETATVILLKHLTWNKSKIHLIFIAFKQLLEELAERCKQSPPEEGFILSACAFSMEKWANQINGMKKDFARIAPYFISIIVSCVATVSLLPAVKIHLVNCLNSLLNISDYHTVAHLLRVMKPGHQQVFASLNSQFKKYHKYSGKI